jgi:hypothetical protein
MRLTRVTDSRPLKEMDGSMEEFQRIVTEALSRFHAQLAQPVSAAHLRRLAGQLGTIVEERGLPRPLPENECGAPGGMPDQECAALVARVMDGLEGPVLADAARQLVKACFYPEFRNCRDSFRELARDGSCRRQELERARRRLSGSHCVDCPHWVALTPAEHAEFLRREWRAAASEFSEHQEIFLPEDFRVLRRWLYQSARRSDHSEEKNSSRL